LKSATTSTAGLPARRAYHISAALRIAVYICGEQSSGSVTQYFTPAVVGRVPSIVRVLVFWTLVMRASPANGTRAPSGSGSVAAVPTRIIAPAMSAAKAVPLPATVMGLPAVGVTVPLRAGSS